MTRSQFRILLATGLVLAVLLITIPLATLSLIRAEVTATRANSEANRASLDYVKACTTPTGQCYQDSQRSREGVERLAELSQQLTDDTRLLAERQEIIGKALCQRQMELAESVGAPLRAPCPPALPPKP